MAFARQKGYFLTSLATLTILSVCLTYLAYREYTSLLPTTTPNPTSRQTNRRSTGLRPGVEKMPHMQRSALPRFNRSISSFSEDFSSRFYSVWTDDASQSARKTGNDITVVFWNAPGWRPRCPSMPQCALTADRQQYENADAVLFWFKSLPHVYDKDFFPKTRPSHQRWIYYVRDCPHFTRDTDFASYGGVFNWTMSYRNDSDVLAHWGHITEAYHQLAQHPADPNRNYAKEKSKLIIWYVSHCYKYMSRFPYATELMKHIQVDVFGRCGNINKTCPRNDGRCFREHIRQYKFYLAFEDFKCVDYITEKYWDNSLKNDAVPVVLGAPRSDFERLTPPNSYIHVDDFESPEALAKYLKYLDQNDEEYNKYFAWKTQPPKNPLPSLFEGDLCELCKKLSNVSPTERKVYTDIDRWWRGQNYEFCEPLVYTGAFMDPRYLIFYN
ncbi:4-galactosyl-N-acetylglucosaminide 3-alpha-L-fucosyltransferase FUT5-like [Branchiostoma floridae x Branchiostoma japonicum]